MIETMTDLLITSHGAPPAKATTLAIPNGDTIELAPGMPVYMINGQLKRACAMRLGTASVCGLVAHGTPMTLPAQVVTGGVLELAQPGGWMMALDDGYQHLIPDATYYLSATSGKLTTVPQNFPERAHVVVGVALSVSALLVRVAPPILL